MTQAPGSTPRNLDEAEDHPWVDHAARFGLVAYGVVHLLIMWLALQLALGDREGTASSSGALHQLAEQPFGKVGLWLVAIGMLLLVVWRVLEAIAGHDGEEGSGLWAKRGVSVLKAVLYGSLGVTALQVAVGGGSQGKGGTDGTTATIMGLPGGQLLVGLVALAVLAYAGFEIRQAVTEKFRENLDAAGKSGETGRAYVLLGKAGYAAKGVAIGIIGILFGYAAITQDPKKSGGLDQALQQVLEQPFGPVLLSVVALGIGAYGVFCFARARHLSR